MSLLLFGAMIGSVAFIRADNSTTTPTDNSTTTPAASFDSAFDTFVVPGSVQGFGAYQAHNSSTFKPGEKILLYIEPVGYSYQPMGSLFLMNFTADVLVSDKAGHVLTGLQNLPLSAIISHHKNKELLLTVSLTQNHPFPPGDYVLKYTIHDVPSGNSFDILKNITIATG
jgi:hypothetical protein